MPTISQCTVEELRRAHANWGVPHFQRGSVWGDEQKSLLLESLFYDTPCGSIITWEPALEDGEAHGVMFGGGPAPISAVLVVDGQQRIRTIWEVFGTEPDCHAVWCLNLTRLKAVEAALRRNGARRRDRAHPLFVRGRAEGAFVALHRLRSGEWEPPPDLPNLDGGTVEARARQMLSAELNRAHYAGDSLMEMVGLYNRINSAGIAVRDEERAYASMVALNPSAGRWLDDLFAEVHQKDSTDRNESLRRRREREFGFSTFVRAFLQAVAFHTNQVYRSPPGHGLLLKPYTVEQLEQNAQSIPALFGDAAGAVTRTARALRDHLHCDDFRFVPETMALLPAFQLALKYPNAPVDLERLIAWSVLRFSCASLPQAATMKAVQKLRDTLSLEECVAVILKETKGEQRHIVLDGVRSSRSMQGRWVSLLYCLERQRGARDLSEAAPLVAKCSEVEKQHVVPYSKLRAIYRELDSARPSTHKAHQLGNLTYLSGQLNQELGSALQDITKFPDLLGAHLFGPEALEHFAILQEWDAAPSEVTAERARGAFDAMCSARATAIAAAISEWERTLRPSSLPGTRPRTQRIALSRMDHVRQLGFDGIEDELAELVRIAPGYSQSKPLITVHRGRNLAESAEVVLRDPPRLTIRIGRNSGFQPNLGPPNNPLEDRVEWVIDVGNQAETARQLLGRLAEELRRDMVSTVGAVPVVEVRDQPDQGDQQ